ncbi:MAG: SRPBCC family protein [Thermoleophilaceae bacterium]
MAVVRESIATGLTPERAFELWGDIRRWPTFIDDFGHPEGVDPEWPATGSKLVWQSKPHGRGRVTQKVVAYEPPNRLQMLIFEDRLSGTQTASFERGEDGRTIFELQLEYELTKRGVLAVLTDALFIRRALRDSLARTCRRFASEAMEEASL